MSLIDDLKKVFEDVESEVKTLGDEIEEALEKAAQAVETGLKKVENWAAKELTTALSGYLEEELENAKKDYLPTIELAANFAKSIASSMNASAIQSSLTSALDPDNPSSSAASSVIRQSPAALFAAQAGGGLASEFKNAGFHSASVGVVGELSLGVGAAASAGAGQKWDLSEPRIIVDFGLSVGVEEGADTGLYVGFWRRDTEDLQEAYVAMVLEADFVVGFGVKFYFSMSEKDFVGFVVTPLSDGEELEVSAEVGYTYLFRLPGS